MSALNLNEEKTLILQQFRKNLEDVLAPSHNDRFLLRWLRARDFNLENAEAMLRNHLKLRKKMKVDEMIGNYELKATVKPFERTTFLGFTKCGHPVRFFNIGGSDLKGTVRCMTVSECIEYFVARMETDLKRLAENNEKNGTHVETCIYINDWKDIKVSQFIDKKVMRICIHFIHLYQDHYPETLHSFFNINVPSVFPLIFNIFKPFFHENVIKKMHFFGYNDCIDEIFKIVPREIVPAYVGGTRYGPGDDPLCHDILNWNPKVPASSYLSSMESLDAKSPGVCKATVRRRSMFEIEQVVDKPGVVLCWEFQTKHYEIRFGLFLRRQTTNKRGVETVKKELIPVESVESHEVVERGHFTCKKTGTYVLLFDNTYSWLVSKQLLYRIELRSSSAQSSVEDLTFQN